MRPSARRPCRVFQQRCSQILLDHVMHIAGGQCSSAGRQVWRMHSTRQFAFILDYWTMSCALQVASAAMQAADAWPASACAPEALAVQSGL